jgi:general secretion pathway protein H
MRTSTRIPPSDVRRDPIRSAAGFTLLELSIVLLILAIAATFVIPRLRNADSAALQSSAARLATTVRYLYAEAAFRRRPMRLNLDLDKQAYWVTVLNDDPDEPEFVVDGSPLSRPTVLHDAVAFADVVLPALGTVEEGVVFAQFLPEGWADPLVVHLKGARNEYATLAIDPLTGRTRVGEGYIELGAPAATVRTDGTGAGARERSARMREELGDASRGGRR